MIFNHSSSRMTNKGSNFLYSGDSLSVLYSGDYYNFKLDESTKKSKKSIILGDKIKKDKNNENYYCTRL